MIWVLVIGIIGFILVKFFVSLSQDSDDLQNQKLHEKFETMVNMINYVAFNGSGEITYLHKRSFNLYEDGENQIINFHYSTGHLTIRWKYKYFQKEVVHERLYNNVRNLSLFDQEKIARQFILEMAKVIENHKQNVINNI